MRLGHDASPQTRVLRRRLSLKLLRDWLGFTIAFVLFAFAFNAAVVPTLANAFADTTSTWHYYDKRDYPLDASLRILDATLLATASSWEEVELNGISKTMEELATDIAAEGTSAAESQYLIEQKALLGPYEDINDIPPEAPVLVSEGSATPHWTYPAALQTEAILKTNGLYKDEDWQILETAEAVEARYLSAYNLMRNLKIPIAVMLYLAGCTGIVLVGYGRSLRCFDELSSAVAGMMADRTKPIELPPDLVITQGELNAIRLASLADERAAQAAERRKDELVAYLAHDIRTPLTSVIGYLSLLDEAPDLPADVRERYIRTAEQKSERMEGLIDEFFEITRYNLHAIPIERERVDVAVLCLQVAEEFYPEASAKGVTIQVDAPDEAVAFIDPEKLARALGNLVRNGVAYANADSEVRIEAHTEESTLTLAVTDQGREISPEHLESIFEKFYREDSSRHTKAGNSGLGLAIAKEIVTAHGGTIAAQSEKGTTTFTIHVPLGQL